MNKSKKAVLIFAILSFVIILALLIISIYKNNSKEIIFYYGAECPHCAIVEKYIKENKIDIEFNIIKKEVYHNKNNALELYSIVRRCNLNTNEIGVPLIYSKGKCYIGDKDSINFLKIKMGEIK